MNWTVYGFQIGLLLVLFGAVVAGGMTKDPVSFVSDYPPEIQAAYYASQHRERPKTQFTKKELARKGIALLAGLFLMAWMAHAVGAEGYGQGCLTAFSYIAAVTAFDTFVLDWIFFPRVKRWRLPGTEQMDAAYAQKAFHVKVVLRIAPLFLVYALLAGGVMVLIF